MAAWRRVVRWEGWSGDSLERLTILQDNQGVHAEGLVNMCSAARSYDLKYRLQIDGEWKVREVWIELADGGKVHIFSDGSGRWTDAQGFAIANLAGCIDVDIAATPFTNTSPIRRLNPTTGSIHSIKVAYVSVPDLVIEPVEQRYTRLSDKRFRYDGVSTGFSVELDIDEDGIVLDYPSLFRRLP